ncbi:hypothetical protein SISSUDRAFT_68809 [Sistotremastrum suecicum HHB10207 ss-3]|uniref:Uncharacterized protein n=1 Tax=Sistotremastrum suecicum HHB10207 ss-3 TaxID=1314776 RepID=A0A166BI96_9AGAM|nr:hypothetical protein SISSUDRAFT_68809 [Sistotremastrum suecicum HHB10207 ss-3]
MYGLLRALNEDYRPAHSGAFYSVVQGSNGWDDSSTINTLSTFGDDDLLSEPRLPKDQIDQLPPIEYVPPKYSTTPPKYKATSWLAVFPQYRFHFGMVQVVWNLQNTYLLNVSNVGKTLDTLVNTGAGQKLLDETFFVNVTVPATDVPTVSNFNAAVNDKMYKKCAVPWLMDSNGKKVDNPFDNKDFYSNPTYDPTWTKAQFDKLGKYIIQIMILRSFWEYPPSWTGDNQEGRNVPNYWKFRLSGVTCDQYLETAFSSPCYQNTLHDVQDQLSTDYFLKTDYFTKSTLGSGYAAFSMALSDSRLLPSLGQLTPSGRSKLVDSISQLVNGGGPVLSNALMSYLANSNLETTLTPVNYNVVTEIPIASDDSDSPAPEDWEVQVSCSL